MNIGKKSESGCEDMSQYNFEVTYKSGLDITKQITGICERGSGEREKISK